MSNTRIGAEMAPIGFLGAGFLDRFFAHLL